MKGIHFFLNHYKEMCISPFVIHTNWEPPRFLEVFQKVNPIRIHRAILINFRLHQAANDQHLNSDASEAFRWKVAAKSQLISV